MGRYLHVPPIFPDSEWDPSSFKTPWWRDESLCIGRLTEKTRKIRIINQLTKADDIIEVCSEETMNEILDRYFSSTYEYHEEYQKIKSSRTVEKLLSL